MEVEEIEEDQADEEDIEEVVVVAESETWLRTSFRLKRIGSQVPSTDHTRRPDQPDYNFLVYSY